MSNINNIAYENIGKIYNLYLNDIIQNNIGDIDYVPTIKKISLNSPLYKMAENNEKYF